jgi:hypothetical protein
MVKAQIVDIGDKMAIRPDAIARAIAFAIEQPANINVNEIVIRPTAQGVASAGQNRDAFGKLSPGDAPTPARLVIEDSATIARTQTGVVTISSR